ncbi:MAG: hypothetical protein K0R17_1177 [Rariglobus sp.]|jgi:hypothetical protein|nr:hypothetical protein [Rariglobus sp.]
MTTALRLFCLSGALALPLSAQTVTTLLNDTFADNDRTNQSLSTSSQWFVSGTSGNLTASGGTLNQATTGMTGLTYFTASGSPVSLGVTESIKLTFDVSFATTGNSAAGFRSGLFNSGTRMTGDSFGVSNAAFTGSYAGYLGGVNTAAASNNILRFYERGTSTTLIGGSIGTGYVQLGASGGGAFKTFAASSIYTGTLTITRTDISTVSVSLSYTGVFTGDSVSSTQTATVVDTAGLTTSFDTLAFSNTAGSSYTLDNIKIDYTAVPEPSTYAALAGVLALGVVALRRRQGV